MSIRDKINFWEQKKVVQEPKPFPKPAKFQDKKFSVNSSSLTNDTKLALVTENSSHENILSQTQKKQGEVQRIPVNSITPVLLTVQSTQSVTYIPLNAKPQIELKASKSADESNLQKQQVISVKNNINKFNNMTFPILGQGAQSCFISTFKKTQSQQKPDINNNKNQKQPQNADLSHSTPLYEVEKEDQHKMSFKDKIELVGKMFTNRSPMPGMPKKNSQQHNNDPQQNDQHSEEPNEHEKNSQVQLNQHNPIKIEIKQSYHTDTNGKSSNSTNPTTEEQKQANDESDKQLMKASIQEHQKPATLLGGQLNNLSLQTRMKRKSKKKTNDEDFDDM